RASPRSRSRRGRSRRSRRRSAPVGARSAAAATGGTPRRRPRGAPERAPDRLDPPRALAQEVSLDAVGAQPVERQVALIGAPLDPGSGRRGVDMGPSAIRYAELAEHLAEKLGIVTDDFGNVEAPVAEAVESQNERAHFLPQILELCDRVAKLVAEAA